MARHEIVIHENTGATKEVAPYLGSYIAKETLQIPAFAAAIGLKCGLPAIQVIAILTGSFEAIQALERESLVRAWTDIGVVCAVITGSFPTADAAFDPGRNALELALRLDDTLRIDLADTVPTIITDANLTKLRVDNVMDLEVERPMNLIHGQHTFRVAGFNMVLGDEGAAAFLQNALGTTFALVIDRVVTHQLFEAHTAELLPGGDYKLVVKSRAGDAAGPLQTSFRKVKYLRVVDPEPEPVPIAQSSDGGVKIFSLTAGGQSEAFDASHTWDMTCEGFFHEAGEGHRWRVGAVDILGIEVGGEERRVSLTVDTATDGRSATLIGADTEDLPPGTYEDAILDINITDETNNDNMQIPIKLVVSA